MFGAAAQGHGGSSPGPLSSEAVDLLGHALCRTLVDKSYEKRKTAALEIEQIIRVLQQYPNRQEAANKTQQILTILRTEFLDNPLPNVRKGGLIGLASCAIGLERGIVRHLKDLIKPILICFSDQDQRVRYYACESMYNVTKVARADVMLFFNDIFDGLCKLFADVDAEVKHGGEYLDRLIKDIVSEVGSFDIESFLPILSQRVTVLNPFIRSLVLSWIALFNTIPDVEMTAHIPSVLGGVFSMLADTNRDVRHTAAACLNDLLGEFKRKKPLSDYPRVVRDVASIVLQFTSSPDKLCRLTAFGWLHMVVESCCEDQDRAATEAFKPPDGPLVAHLSQILIAVLHNVDDKEEDIRKLAFRFHTTLFLGVHDAEIAAAEQGTRVDLAVNEIVSAVIEELEGPHGVASRIVSLQWLCLLLTQRPTELDSFNTRILGSLLDTLDHPDSEVLTSGLQVLSQIATRGDMFELVCEKLVNWLAADKKLKDQRGRNIIRQLCQLVDVRKFYITVAKRIDAEENLNTAHHLVQLFNWILLTSKETVSLREDLRGRRDADFFQAIILPWFHNAIATLALVLWVEEYDLADAIVQKLGDIEPGLDFLVQLDQLIQLIESPVFSRLRLRSLNIVKYPSLVRTLAGLAMLMPQATAFETLRKRLDMIQIANVGSSNASFATPDSGTNDVHQKRTKMVENIPGLLAALDAMLVRHQNALADEDVEEGMGLSAILAKNQSRHPQYQNSVVPEPVDALTNNSVEITKNGEAPKGSGISSLPPISTSVTSNAPHNYEAVEKFTMREVSDAPLAPDHSGDVSCNSISSAFYSSDKKS